jgi:hypothetical protein
MLCSDCSPATTFSDVVAITDPHATITWHIVKGVFTSVSLCLFTPYHRSMERTSDDVYAEYSIIVSLKNER